MGEDPAIPESARSSSSLVRFFLQPVRDLFATLEALVVPARRPLLVLGGLLVCTSAGWFLYVPIHELAHVAGCELTGGEVRQIALAPLYGGRLLEGVVPGVVAGEGHAGRITSFSTGRSDLCYLATDILPYVLSILAVPLLRLAAKRRSVLLAGLALVPAVAPFLGLTGDYYEMGSVLVTRAMSPWEAPPDPGQEPPGVMRLRTDDPGGLVLRFREDPAALDEAFPAGPVAFATGFAASALVGVFLALATYALGDLLARKVGLAPREG